MAFIYIDESGDLGTGKKSCEYFVIAAVKVDKEEVDIALRRIPKKIRARKLSKKLKETAELKFSNSSEEVRRAFLKAAAKLDIGIFCLAINKKGAAAKIRNNMHIAYNYFIKMLLEEDFGNISRTTRLKICLDKCMPFAEQQKFEDYIKMQIILLFKESPHVLFEQEVSQNNAALQVTDFICGAFGYKYNTSKQGKGYSAYTDIIKAKIRLEKEKK